MWLDRPRMLLLAFSSCEGYKATYVGRLRYEVGSVTAAAPRGAFLYGSCGKSVVDPRARYVLERGVD